MLISIVCGFLSCYAKRNSQNDPAVIRKDIWVKYQRLAHRDGSGEGLHQCDLSACVCVSVCLCVCLFVCVLSHFSHVWPFVTPWTVAHQTPLSMEFSRQEYWTGLPCPPPGYLPDPGIELASVMSLHWQVGSLPLVPPGKPLLSTSSNLNLEPLLGLHDALSLPTGSCKWGPAP